ncbi:MAG: hypothetical protein E4H23_00260 [Chrysiogenales bacterium]|nr:hypothetical protein [Candidatus Aminicenantes bacterium]TFG81069.1 MAG: hypothetical protein E4H23_00260 [Chrysiogenales bacterium]
MKISQSRPAIVVMFMIAAVAMFLQQGCRSLQNIPGQWLAFAAGADGRIEDFSNKITSHLFENGMMVGVGNDDRFLYIFFSPDISHRQRPPSRASLTLWLDENGGKAQKLGLVHVSEQERRKMAGPEARLPEQKNLDGAALLEIVNRKSGKETFISADGSLGPSIRLSDDWGDFAYQWRIPFQALAEWPGLNHDPGKALGIGLLWNIEPLPGLDRADLDRARPGPGRGMTRENFKTERKIWLKTVLVQKK